MCGRENGVFPYQGITVAQGTSNVLLKNNVFDDYWRDMGGGTYDGAALSVIGSGGSNNVIVRNSIIGQSARGVDITNFLGVNAGTIGDLGQNAFVGLRDATISANIGSPLEDVTAVGNTYYDTATELPSPFPVSPISYGDPLIDSNEIGDTIFINGVSLSSLSASSKKPGYALMGGGGVDYSLPNCSDPLGRLPGECQNAVNHRIWQEYSLDDVLRDTRTGGERTYADVAYFLPEVKISSGKSLERPSDFDLSSFGFVSMGSKNFEKYE